MTTADVIGATLEIAAFIAVVGALVIVALLLFATVEMLRRLNLRPRLGHVRLPGGEIRERGEVLYPDDMAEELVRAQQEADLRHNEDMDRRAEAARQRMREADPDEPPSLG